VLVIKIELHPFGQGGKHVRELGRMVIANVGGTDESGDYEVRAALLPRGAQHDAWREPQLTGTVTGHARLAEPVWSLLAKALHSIGFGALGQRDAGGE
jgi:hypothetical protein